MSKRLKLLDTRKNKRKNKKEKNKMISLQKGQKISLTKDNPGLNEIMEI